MAALTPKLIATHGDTTQARFYLVRNVDSGDTCALSAHFSRILTAQAVNLTRSLAAFSPSIAGTTITLTEASMADDTCVLMVTGAAAAST